MSPKQQRLQYGTYYSNQPGGRGGTMQRLLIVGVVIAAVIGIALFATTLLSGNSKNDLTLLAARENSLLTLANASQKSIRDPELITANSNAAVLLTSDVVSILNDTGIKKLPEDMVKREADPNSEALKQAGLLNKFDITYRGIVLDKVSSLISQAQTVRDTISNKKNLDLVDKVLVNLRSIEAQFTAVDL